MSIAVGHDIGRFDLAPSRTVEGMRVIVNRIGGVGLAGKFRRVPGPTAPEASSFIVEPDESLFTQAQTPHVVSLSELKAGDVSFAVHPEDRVEASALEATEMATAISVHPAQEELPL